MTHAIRIHKPGGPEVLVWDEIEVGRPAPARSCSATPRSASTSSTSTTAPASIPLPLPSSIGSEGAGVVEAVGAGRHRPQGRRPRRLCRRDRRLCRGAADPGRPAGQASGRDRRPTAAAMMLKGMTVALPDPRGLPGQARRDHPGPCRRRRRRPDPVPMGQGISAPPSSAPVGTTRRPSWRKAHGCDHPIVYTRERLRRRG